MDLSQYKLIYFLNTFKFDVGQWDKIKKRLPEKASLMWNYAGGIFNPNFSFRNIEKTTASKFANAPKTQPQNCFQIVRVQCVKQI